jgi:tryptophan synthase beta subunit
VATQLAAERGRPVQLVVCTSGRGDKDLRTVIDALLPSHPEPHAAH